ncbi:hypothetical protein [Pseudomonas kuykendallii]|uniref:hypothetical protein n=1 Tax=Pseudomonas kuykendallii TaxID=1007099 RepID=UPI00235521BA|nr:hypothetical protein [Pseudomonas kuykendallii]
MGRVPKATGAAGPAVAAAAMQAYDAIPECRSEHQEWVKKSSIEYVLQVFSAALIAN